MATAPEYVWFFLAAVGFAAGLTVLGVLAAAVRDQTADHDLHLRVSRLRSTLPTVDDVEVIEVGEAPIAPPTEPAAVPAAPEQRAAA